MASAEDLVHREDPVALPVECQCRQEHHSNPGEHVACLLDHLQLGKYLLGQTNVRLSFE